LEEFKTNEKVLGIIIKRDKLSVYINMSQVIFPPSHYFVGITFNSAFYNETNSDSLTQDQANKLYISKNYNDFANGIISLNGGAKANTISSIGSVANLYEDTSLYPTNTVNLCQNNKNLLNYNESKFLEFQFGFIVK
jgi:hypothetical protein